MINLSLLIITILFGLYFTACGVQFGVSILHLWQSSNRYRGARKVLFGYFTPFWEMTNIFLLLGGIGLIALFNNSLSPLYKDLRYSLIACLVMLLTRVGCVIYLFYFAKPEKHTNNINVLLVVSSLLVPLLLGIMSVRLVTGVPVWQGHSNQALGLTILVSVVSLAISFSSYQFRKYTLQSMLWLNRILAGLFCIMAAIMVQIVINHSHSHLLSLPYSIFIIMSSLIIAIEVILWLFKKEYLLFWYLLGLSIIAAPLWAFADKPFFIFPSLSIVQAYRYTMYSKPALAGICLIAGLAVLLIIHLLRLFRPSMSRIETETTSKS